MTTAAGPNATELVAAFWRRFHADGGVDRAAVRRLAGLAIGEGAEAEAAVRALFAEIVEPLGDAFDSAAVRAYADAFAEVIDVARHHPAAAALDAGLCALGLTSRRIAARGRRNARAVRPAPIGEPQLAIVPSRITIGSDVVISTTIMAGLLQRFPDLRVLFLGPLAAQGLVAGNPRIDFHVVDYPRRGDLLARLGAWPKVRAVVRAATAGLAGDEWVVVDTDSFLTQLNLLPLAPDAQTRYFPKGTIQAPGAERLGQLAGFWTQRLTGLPARPVPTLWLPAVAHEWAAALRARLAGHAPRWAVVNLGVGGNPRKSLGADFEDGLLRRLIGAGVGVLLAAGPSPAEVEAACRLADQVGASGVDVVHLPKDGPADALDKPGRRQIVTWQGSTAQMAALVAAADLHVGYDSAGQHVAAAVGTAGVTAFVPTGGERFFQRWSAWGRGPTRVVRFESDAVDPTAAERVAAAGLALLGAS